MRIGNLLATIVVVACGIRPVADAGPKVTAQPLAPEQVWGEWALLGRTYDQTCDKASSLFVGSRRGAWSRIALVVLNGEVRVDELQIEKSSLNVAQDFDASHAMRVVDLGHGAPIDEVSIVCQKRSGKPEIQLWGLPAKREAPPAADPPALYGEVWAYGTQRSVAIEIGPTHRVARRFVVIPGSDGFDITGLSARLLGGDEIALPLGRSARGYESAAFELPQGAARLQRLTVHYKMQNRDGHVQVQVIGR